jgi:uncharacterized protein YegJ (DUF2314 family)
MEVFSFFKDIKSNGAKNYAFWIDPIRFERANIINVIA